MALEFFLLLEFLFQTGDTILELLVEFRLFLGALLFADLAFFRKGGGDLETQGQFIEVVLFPDRNFVVKAVEGHDLKGRGVGGIFLLLVTDEDVFELRVREGALHRRNFRLIEVLPGGRVGELEIVGLGGALEFPVAVFLLRHDLDRFDLFDFEEGLVDPLGRVGLHFREGLADEVDGVAVAAFHVASGLGRGHAAAEGIGPAFGTLVDFAEPEGADVLTVLVLKGEQRRGFFRSGGFVGSDESEAAVLAASDCDGLDDIDVPDLAQEQDDRLGVCRVAVALAYLPGFFSFGESDRTVLFLDDDPGDVVEGEVGVDLFLVGRG